MAIPFQELPGFHGDPFFALEPMAGKHVQGHTTQGDFRQLLESAKHPSQIEELQGMEPIYGDLPILVVRAPDMQGEFGFCYQADEYPALNASGVFALMALNPDLSGCAFPLKELFIHEFTHAFTGEGHGWDFLCAFNAFRTRCGLEPSTDPYDVRDGFEEGMLPDELATDVGIAQAWCAKVGSELALLPDIGESITGAILYFREELYMWSRAADAATAPSFMALADKLRAEVRKWRTT